MTTKYLYGYQIISLHEAWYKVRQLGNFVKIHQDSWHSLTTPTILGGCLEGITSRTPIVNSSCENLQYFVNKGVCKSSDDFNIPKLHLMHHYIDSIISRGSVDEFSTESPKHLHINFAKNAYRATNKRNYLKQMKTMAASLIQWLMSNGLRLFTVLSLSWECC